MATKTQKTMFKVGDRVVCVDDSPAFGDGSPFPICTGSEWRVSKSWDDFFGSFVMLDGAPPWADSGHAGFNSVRFRRVQDQSITAKLVEQFKEGYVEECPEYVPQTQEV